MFNVDTTSTPRRSFIKKELKEKNDSVHSQSYVLLFFTMWYSLYFFIEGDQHEAFSVESILLYRSRSNKEEKNAVQNVL